VLGSVVLALVNAQNDSDVFIRSRGRDDDLLDGGTEVRLGLLCVGEEAGRLDDNLCAD